MDSEQAVVVEVSPQVDPNLVDIINNIITASKSGSAGALGIFSLLLIVLLLFKAIDLPMPTRVLMAINRFMIAMGWLVVPMAAVATLRARIVTTPAAPWVRKRHPEPARGPE